MKLSYLDFGQPDAPLAGNPRSTVMWSASAITYCDETRSNLKEFGCDISLFKYSFNIEQNFPLVCKYTCPMKKRTR